MDRNFQCPACKESFSAPQETERVVKERTKRFGVRYTRMYGVANTGVLLGRIIKIGSLCLVGIWVLFWVEAVSSRELATGEMWTGAKSIIRFLVKWILLFAFGHLLVVVSEMLRANTDMAVESSSFVREEREKMDLLVGDECRQKIPWHERPAG